MNRITIVCDRPDHRRDLARFERNAAGEWEALKSGSWLAETRGTDELESVIETDTSTGKRIRRTTMRAPRERWQIWCPTCEHSRPNRIVLLASTLGGLLTRWEQLEVNRASIADMRHALRHSS